MGKQAEVASVCPYNALTTLAALAEGDGSHGELWWQMPRESPSWARSIACNVFVLIFQLILKAKERRLFLPEEEGRLCRERNLATAQGLFMLCWPVLCRRWEQSANKSHVVC